MQLALLLQRIQNSIDFLLRDSEPPGQIMCRGSLPFPELLQEEL